MLGAQNLAPISGYILRSSWDFQEMIDNGQVNFPESFRAFGTFGREIWWLWTTCILSHTTPKIQPHLYDSRLSLWSEPYETRPEMHPDAWNKVQGPLKHEEALKNFGEWSLWLQTRFLVKFSWKNDLVCSYHFQNPEAQTGRTITWTLYLPIHAFSWQITQMKC